MLRGAVLCNLNISNIYNLRVSSNRDSGILLVYMGVTFWDEGVNFWDEGVNFWDEGVNFWDEGVIFLDEGVNF